MQTNLHALYKEVYNEGFDFLVFDKRVKLQKAVYLLENMGVNIGDYSFSWAKYGPYSVGLDRDSSMTCCYNDPSESFSSSTIKAINCLKKILKENSDYSDRYWIECIASLHFLSFVKHDSKEKAFEKLRRQKAYLSNESANEKAFGLISEITVVE